ncbi:hypothetical protein FBUS_03651 [Fasciolopsis buskii]|uniref:Uncharacterized protein n=1 Tax=Fasciolopsis buskii TaxID=27845 RepID=A0A8E0VGL5_9TREM|nr:hypothetical protein FBUS_03651 [Fasciolopsis buski]
MRVIDERETRLSRTNQPKRRLGCLYSCPIYFRYRATGATLGVMAIVLVLFLFLLCLPWSKCRRLKRCFSNQTSDENDAVMSRQRGQQSQNNFFPMSILDLFPPSMLPKLPDYEECMRDDDIPPPATPPPSMITQSLVRTRVSVENRVDHSQSGGSIFGSEGSTPPPYSSAVHSPSESGEPAPASATSQTTHSARHSPPALTASETETTRSQSAVTMPPVPPPPTTTTAATAITLSPPQSLSTTESEARASAQSLQIADEANSLSQR